MPLATLLSDCHYALSRNARGWLVKTCASMAVAAGFVLLVAVVGPTAVTADEFPTWAYPKSIPGPPSTSTAMIGVPGSPLKVKESAIDDPYNPPDWFPDTHPPMPEVVAHGKPPVVKACARCHLPTGAGHPESADLAALPLGYITQQMADFKNGTRNGLLAAPMRPIAQALSDDEVMSAAKYFAGLVDPVWTKVIETKTVPKTYVSFDALRLLDPKGGEEPLGDRIIVLPEDPKNAMLVALRSGFFSYVPVGSVAKGKEIVETGASGRSIPCSACHGADLLGMGDTPHISGRSPLYVFRQLNDFKTGAQDRAECGCHAAGGRQPRPKRHDRDRGLSRHAQALSVSVLAP